MNCRLGLLIIQSKVGKKQYEKKKCSSNTSTSNFVADLDDCKSKFLSKQNQMRLIGDSSYLIINNNEGDLWLKIIKN